MRVSSPARMKEYYQNPTATNAFFQRDKTGRVWGCTGDIGYVDRDGDVFILGRASDCYYTPDKVLIYLFDAEYVILRDLAVAQCKVIDIDVNGRSVPVAHIILKNESAEKVDDMIHRIDDSCRRALKGYAVPQAYKLRDVFPVHSNGKRDNELLQTERDGFINADGEAVYL